MAEWQRSVDALHDNQDTEESREFRRTGIGTMAQHSHIATPEERRLADRLSNAAEMAIPSIALGATIAATGVFSIPAIALIGIGYLVGSTMNAYTDRQVEAIPSR